MLDINFGMQLVRVSRISGVVSNPDGTPVTSGNVNLMADTGGARGNQIGVNFGGRIQWDGAFTIANVPPGRYILRARGDDSETPQFAAQPISVNGDDLSDVTVILSAGATISGTVSFLPGGSPAPDFTQFRITAPSTDQSDFGPQPNARVDKDGHFTIERRVGRRAPDPAEQRLAHVDPEVGDRRRPRRDRHAVRGAERRERRQRDRGVHRQAERDQRHADRPTTARRSPSSRCSRSRPIATLWRPLSRQIVTARPDQTGKYRIRGLPPGDYYLATVDPSQQGEWFEPAYLDEHRTGAVRVVARRRRRQDQDFKVSLK